MFCIFYFVGRKGEKGESSKAEIANLEKMISKLLRNVTENLGIIKYKNAIL